MFIKEVTSKGRKRKKKEGGICAGAVVSRADKLEKIRALGCGSPICFDHEKKTAYLFEADTYKEANGRPRSSSRRPRPCT